MTITIQGANDDPTGMDGSGMVTAAGSGMVGTAAMGNVEGADVDSDDTLSYAVGTQASHGTLTVDPATGAWTYMVNEDDAAVQALGAGETAMDTGTIVISDDQGGSTTVEVEITITGIVDMPTVDVTTDTVAENDAMGPNLAEVTSPDSGVTFSVDNPAFEIIMVGSTHVLKLKDGHSLDHETSGGSVTLMVTASDGVNMSHAAEVVITVSDVNEAPMIEAADGAVDENAAGATVGAVMVSDYDAADAGLGDANISVSDDRFEVVGGMLKLKDGVSLDHESEDSVMVTVTVTDTGTNGEALSASAEVTVTVNDLNENPKIEVKDGETPDGMMARSVISENATGLVGEITVSDVDDGDVLTVSVPMDSGFAVTTDAEGGYWLELTDAVDFETHQSVTVTVTVEDDAGGSASFDATVQITDTNEDPTIMVTGLMPVDEDMANQEVGTIVVDDVDAGDSLGAGNIEVSDDRFVVRANADGSLTLFLVQAIDAEEETSVDVTLTVTDTGNGLPTVPTRSADTTVTVMVAGENETPMISIGNGVTPDGMAASGMADENMADVPIAKITASDPEQGGLNHDSLTIVDENGMEVTDGPFMIAADPEDGVSWLKLATAQDFETDGGTHTVIVRVTDAGGLYMDQAYTVTINNVNEAPMASDGSGAVTAGEEMPATASGELMPMDYDAGTTFELSVQTDAMYGTFMVEDDGSWTYTIDDENAAVLALNEGAELTDTIEVIVTDSGIPGADGTMHTMATVAITITGVNDDPKVEITHGVPLGETAPTNGFIMENETGIVARIMVSDDDAGDMLSVSVPMDSGFAVHDDGEGGHWLQVTDPINFEMHKSVDVTVTVDDGNGGSNSVVATVHVIDADEDPTIMVTDLTPPAEEVDENQDVATIVVNDVDAKDSLDAGDIMVSDDRFFVRTNSDDSLTLVLGRAIDAEKEASVEVTLTVTDTGSNTDVETITVMIVGENEPVDLTIETGVTEDGTAASGMADENVADVPLYKITAEDPEDGPLNHDSLMIVDEDGMEVTDGPFMIVSDPVDGVSWLKLASAVNFEEVGAEHTVLIRATDSEERSVVKSAMVTINDVNEAPTASDGMGEATAGSGMPVEGNLAVMDEDMGQTHTFDPMGADYGTLTINPEDGSWSYMVDEDHEMVQKLGMGDVLTDIITVTVTDDGDMPMSDEATISITITGVNDAPTLEVMDAFVGSDPANSTIKENETRPVGEVIITDAEGNLTQDDIELSDPVNFELETDAEDRIWLKLVNPFDYEALPEDSRQPNGDKHVVVQLKLTDGEHMVVTPVTIKVVDDNDPPTPTMDAKDDEGTSMLVVVTRDGDKVTTAQQSKFEVVAGGDGINVELDIDNMFEDQDDDQNFRYHLEGAPSWLKLSSTNPEPGEATRWMLESTAPGNDEVFVQTVKLVAVDQRGGEGEIEFTIIWDDGNDEPYDLIVKDSDGMETYQTEMHVPENMEGVGTGLYVTATDDDNPDHKFGVISYVLSGDGSDKFMVNKETHEIVVKDGESLDFETNMDGIHLTVTAKDGGDASTFVTVTVMVGNENDPVMKGEMPGGWWVTINDQLDPREEDKTDEDYIAEGGWLTFGIEEAATAPGATDGDMKPLFKDEDGSDDLTYSLKPGVPSSSWLMIDPKSGEIKNQAGKIPPSEGVYKVVVVATDGDSPPVEQEFSLAVAFSGAADDGTLTDDNDAPKFTAERGEDIPETSGKDTPVATFSVQDDEWILAEGGHPFAPMLPKITGATVKKGGTQGDALNEADANALFEVKQVSSSGDTRSYQIFLKADKKLDFETIDEYTISLSVQDGYTTTPITETIKVDVTDVNEAPIFSAESGRSTVDGGTYMVDQQKEEKEIVWLNLTRLFSDREDGEEDRDDLTFANLKVDAPGVKALHGGIMAWEDVEDANENTDSFSWGGGETPDDDDYVLILEVDRTAKTGEDGQDTVGEGTVSVTVRDSKGVSMDHAFKIAVNDTNVAPTGEGEGVTFVNNVREGQHVSVTFVESVDPDFDGADNEPVAVLYQVLTADGESGDPSTVAQVSLTREGYEVKQSDVGGMLRGQVIYFQLDGNSIVRSTPDSDVLFKDSAVVSNSEDRGKATFVFNTGDADSNEIEVVATVTDEDVGGEGGIVELIDANYQWQVSDTGSGNWTDFDDGGVSAVITAAQANKYVRVVVTYDGAHGDADRNESFRSEAIKVGAVGEIGDEEIATPIASATVSGGNAAIGSELSLPDTVGKNAEIQWNAGGMAIESATGRTLTVTANHAGLEITVTVREMDDKDGLTSVNTSEGITVDGTARENVAPQGKAPEPIELGAAPAKAGELMQLTSGPIDFSKIFSDFDGDKLDITLGSISGAGNPISAGSDLQVYLSASGDAGNSLLIVDPDTGEVWYHTTQASNHDGIATDGAGNIINMSYTANDGTSDNTIVEEDGTVTTGPVNVGLRIDVKGRLDNEGGHEAFANAEIAENTAGGKGGTTVLTINVFDENEVDHEYGMYAFEVTVDGVMVGSDDSQFTLEVSKTDGSVAMLKLKEGAMLDYEALNGKEIVVKATSLNFGEIEGKTTVSFITDVSEETTPTPTATPNDVPGLKDDDSTDDDEVAEGDDDDTDGGVAPMVGMVDDGLF